MKARTYIAGTAAAGLLTAGAFLAPAMASTQAGCACGVHTARFTSVTKSTLGLSRTSVAQQDTDYNGRGRVIGFDQLNLTFNPKTGAGHGNFTFDTKGGFIYGTLKLTSSPNITGRLTGGTGKFRGVTGTIRARNLNKSGTRTAVTLRYRLR